jgi:hypothetical protein
MSYSCCRGMHLAHFSAIALLTVACAAPDSKTAIPVSDATRRAIASAGGGAPHAQSSLPPSAQPTLPPRARVALDSGNAQLRAKRYDAALASYRVAVTEAPGHVAPEFGVYMAAKRMGNGALADSALRIINAHTGNSPAWTDSAMRSAHSAEALPRAHPAI